MHRKDERRRSTTQLQRITISLQNQEMLSSILGKCQQTVDRGKNDIGTRSVVMHAKKKRSRSYESTTSTKREKSNEPVVPKKPIVSKAPLRDLADESSLSRSKLQGSSELECEETSTAVKRLTQVTEPKSPMQKEAATPTETQQQFADEYTAQEGSLRVAGTPPMGSSSYTNLETEPITTARSHTPVTAVTPSPDAEAEAAAAAAAVSASATDVASVTATSTTAKPPEVAPKSAGPSEIGADATQEAAPKSAGLFESGTEATQEAAPKSAGLFESGTEATQEAAPKSAGLFETGTEATQEAAPKSAGLFETATEATQEAAPKSAGPSELGPDSAPSSAMK
ncbi:hypothetical protein TELCIR_04235 [Teladorsagia circumcincta]|uniref:Uncharacterized protein n=1 Tax=Teladorsagia circumcincta TaxID=45464 RepID=A0A2G9UUE9_TELCI|nr:hypothetical protein TELCIR_04235 [Teladorsagia circumcincta]